MIKNSKLLLSIVGTVFMCVGAASASQRNIDMPVPPPSPVSVPEIEFAGKWKNPSKDAAALNSYDKEWDLRYCRVVPIADKQEKYNPNTKRYEWKNTVEVVKFRKDTNLK